LGYRVQQRQKKQKKLQKVKYSAVLLMIILLAMFAFGTLKNKKEKVDENVTYKKSPKSLKSPINDSSSNIFSSSNAILVVVGGNEKIEDSKVQDVLLFSKEAKKVVLLKIPSDTVISIPGNDFEKAQRAVKFGGIDMLKTALSNYLKIPIKHYLYISSGEVTVRNLKDVVLTAKTSNLKSVDRIAISKKLSEPKDIEQVNLPVRKIEIAGETFLQPINDKVEKILTVFSSDEAITTSTRNRKFIIDILNGNGIAGSASKVALKLLKNGYEISKIGNLKDRSGKDDFSYKDTKIIVYSNLLAEADKIKKVLGKGTIEQASEKVRKNVIIVVGADLP